MSLILSKYGTLENILLSAGQLSVLDFAVVAANLPFIQLLEAHMEQNQWSGALKKLINRRIPLLTDDVPLLRPLDLVDRDLLGGALEHLQDRALRRLRRRQIFIFLRERGALLGREAYGFPAL
jgi:hypothetical protein